MDQNPYKAPKVEGVVSRNSGSDKRKFRIGVAMAVSAIVLPIVVRLLLPSLVVFIASFYPPDPVPQGAMFLAYLVYLASYPLAAVLFVCGLGLAWVHRHS